MAGIFSRLFKAGEAEAHSLVDKLEDPIKMSEQAVRDLRKDLQESLKSLAEIKSLAIRMTKDADDAKRLAGEVSGPVELLAIEGANHVAHNRLHRHRTQSTDWMAEQPGAAGTA